ncbi:MAG: MFS transporter, partial [Acidimicrobiales bacterium]
MASNRRLLKGLQPLGRAAGQARRRLDRAVGGPARSRVILVLACILALNSADTATVGAAAAPLRHALGISNLDIGLLVAVTSAVGALASIPFGALVDRHRRTRILAWTIVLWGVAMLGSASVSSFGSLLLARVFLGAVTATAG